MRFLNEQEVNLRLFSEKNLANKFGRDHKHDAGITTHKPMRVGSAIHAPKVLKNLAVLLPDKVGVTAKALEMPHNSVSQYRSGKSPTDVHAAVEEKRKEDRLAIQDSAIQKTLLSMKLITPDKLAAVDAKGLSVIAGNLTKVVSNLTEKKEDSVAARTTLIVYAPQIRAVDDYPMLEVEGC